MQTNINPGELVFLANEDLNGKEGRMVKLVNSSGTPKVALPDYPTDLTPYVVTDAQSGAGAATSVLPIVQGGNFRVWLKGTCVPGDTLVLATPDGTVDGAVTVIPETAGNYRQIGIAEEAGVDGQLIKVRPFFDLVTVTE